MPDTKGEDDDNDVDENEADYLHDDHKKFNLLKEGPTLTLSGSSGQWLARVSQRVSFVNDTYLP